MDSFIKPKALFLIIVIFTSLFSIINFSSVVEAQQSCCEKTKTGEACLFTDASNCDLTVRPNNLQNTCDKASYCQLGCCVDSNSGNCFKNTPQAKCTGEGKTFKSSADCLVDECSQGCCVLGSQCFLGTETSCKKSFKALFKDNQFEFNFRQVASELECTNVCRAKEKGCCVSKTEETCKSITRDECSSNDKFESGKFCSSIKECSNCIPKKSKKCSDDDVYYVDSCGNLEDKAEDCNYNKGFICNDKKGEAKCISVNCEKTFDSPSMENDGVTRKNGESWCSYDGKVGLGYDLVGSRHYRNMCINGEEIIEPCRDFREEICIQSEVNLPSGSTYIEAQCRPNNFIDCISTCNQAKPDFPNFEQKILDDKQCCENPLRTCVWAGDDENGKCIPAVPPGFRFWELGASASREVSSFTGQGECSSASQTCQVLYEKKPFGDWECKNNCICEKPEWLEAMNGYCRSLGDCGAHYNIIGQYTSEGFSENSLGVLPQLPFNDVKIETQGLNIKALEPDAEQQVGFAAWMEDEAAVATGIAGLVFVMIGRAIAKHFLTLAGKLAGQAAITLGSKAAAFLGITTAKLAGQAAIQTTTTAVATTGVETAVTSAGVVSASGVAAGGGVAGGAAVGSGGAGALASTTTTATTTIATSSWAMVGTVIAVVGWVLLAYSILTLVWELLTNRLVSTRIVECLPWQAPTGGNDCDKCVAPSKECSEYRCRSLGQTCKIINEGSLEVKCVDSNPNDANSPLISPDQEILTKGYTINSVENGFKLTPKINPFAPLRIGIKTNELARCRISDTHTKSFEEMSNLFGDGLFRKEHNTTLSLIPGQIFNFFVRCEDASGNKNAREYLINFETEQGPDLTAPVIESSSLVDGAKLNANLQQIPLTLFVNEPSECKYDTKENEFNLMTSPLGCALPLTTSLFYKAIECQTVLNIEKQKPNNFFFKCKDLVNNINQESFKLTLISTENLTITNTAPKGDIFATNITLAVSTNGGSDNGISNCRFSEQDTIYENMIDFLNTNTQLSTQPLALILGQYIYYIKCRDSVDNQAQTTINFTVKADTLPPLITSIFKDAANLVFTTNEPSTCLSSLAEDMSNSTKIAENSKQFSTNLNLIHYIQCTDIFNNVMQKLRVITN